jgi:hypothetical protein
VAYVVFIDWSEGWQILWRWPLVRCQEIVVQRCFGSWDGMWCGEVQLFSVVGIERCGFVVQLRRLSALLYERSIRNKKTKRRK